MRILPMTLFFQILFQTLQNIVPTGRITFFCKVFTAFVDKTFDTFVRERENGGIFFGSEFPRERGCSGAVPGMLPRVFQLFLRNGFQNFDQVA